MKEVSDEEALGWRTRFGNVFAAIGKAATISGEEKDLHARVAMLGLDVLLDIIMTNDRAGHTTPGYVYKVMARYGLTEAVPSSTQSNSFRYAFTATGRSKLAARKYALDNPLLRGQAPQKTAARIIEPLSLDMSREDADWNF